VRSGPTIDRFVFEGIPCESSQPSRASQLLAELLRTGQVCIDKSSLGLFYLLFENLGNARLTESLLEFDFSRWELNASNCISRFSTKSQHCLDNSREKSFIALHFYELERSLTENLQVNDLKNILWDESLRMESEDWLLSLLTFLGSDFANLLGFARFEYASSEGIDALISAISCSSLDSRLWSSVCCRLRHRIVLDSDERPIHRYRDSVRTFEPSSPWSAFCRF
jgi:hypothetical protein